MSRVLLGERSDGNVGLFISQSGYDPNTATMTQMVFDSRYGNYGSIIAKGSATCGQTIYFATMPYVPLCYVYIYNSTSVLNRDYWQRAVAKAEADSFTGGNFDGETFVSGVELVQEPCFKVSTSALYLNPTPYVNQSGQSEGSYTARYVVYRCPGGS
jgi:hypothetical protein